MRAAFVLTTIVLALALGIIAGISESRLLTRALIIGFAPADLGCVTRGRTAHRP